MFSKEDFRQYMKQVYTLENRMLELYEAVLDDLEDEKLRNTFKHLLSEEREHRQIADELADI